MICKGGNFVGNGREFCFFRRNISELIVWDILRKLSRANGDA